MDPTFSLRISSSILRDITKDSFFFLFFHDVLLDWFLRFHLFDLLVESLVFFYDFFLILDLIDILLTRKFFKSGGIYGLGIKLSILYINSLDHIENLLIIIFYWILLEFFVSANSSRFYFMDLLGTILTFGSSADRVEMREMIWIVLLRLLFGIRVLEGVDLMLWDSTLLFEF